MREGAIAVTEPAGASGPTRELLRAAHLVVHPRVMRVTLHGSRGPAAGFRPDSDVDLCLLADSRRLTEGSGLVPGLLW